MPANVRLDHNEYVRLSLTSTEDVFKTSSRHLGQDQYIRLGHTSWRRLQDVFKTFLRCLQDVSKTFSRRLQNVFKTFSRHFQDVFKTSSWRLQDIFRTSCKNIFKIFSRHIIKLNWSCWHVFEKYSSRFWDVLFQRRLSTEEFS